MNALALAESHFCLRWAEALMHFLWEGFAIAAMAGVVAWSLRRASTRARYAVYLASLLVMAACLPATFAVVGQPDAPLAVNAPPAVTPAPTDAPPPDFPRPPDVKPIDGTPIPAREPFEATSRPAGAISMPGERARLEPTTQPANASSWHRLAGWATIVYAVGAALMLARMLVGLRGGQRLRRTCTPVNDPLVLEVIHRQAEALGMRVAPLVAWCGRVATPVVVGLLRPAILLPASLASGLTPRQIEVVIAHELAHLRRWDHVAIVFQRIVEAMLFFHPAVWCVSRRLNVERERCCDDLVVGTGTQPATVAETLLRVVELCRSGQSTVHPATSPALTGRRRRAAEVVSRVLRLLDAEDKSAFRLRRLWPMGLVACLLLAAATPLLVSTRAEPATERNQPTESTSSPYDHFLYIRHNAEDGAAKTDTLVLASITPAGIQKRDIYTKRNLHVGWRSLGVFHGKVYALKINSLLEIDIATGRAENLCSTVQASGYDSGVLAAVVYPEPGKPVLRVYDFRNGGYRDLNWPVVEGWIDRIELSPDHKRVAFFTGKRLDGKALPPMSAMLTVVELDSGKVTQPGEPIRYLPPAISSLARIGPPYIWTDPRTILCLRTDVPDENISGGAVMLDGTVNKVITIDAITGKVREVATLPGRPDFTMVKLGRQSVDSVPVWILQGPGFAGTRFRVDLKAGKLVEDDSIGGGFRIHEVGEPQDPHRARVKRLLHGDSPLDTSARDIRASVSPDGKRALWFTGSLTDQRLRCFDAVERNTRTVATGWFSRGWHGERDAFCWLKDDAMRPTAEGGELPPGWTPFADRPRPKPTPPEPDTRKNIADYLEVTLTVDKNEYRRHEPVQVTLVVRNKSDESVEILRPVLFDDRLVNVTLEYTGREGSGGAGLVSDVWSYLPEHEKITVEPSESVSTRGPLEVEGIGDYKLLANLRGLINRGNWRGSLRIKPVTFRVESSSQDEELFQVKFKRLMAKFRNEFQSNPEWDGANTTLQDDVTAMGPKVAPLLIDQIEKTEDPRARKLLYRPIISVANPGTLDFFAAMLERAEGPETACRGLYALTYAPKVEDKALGVLIDVGMGHEKAEVRRAAAEYLKRVDKSQVQTGLTSALDDKDEQVRMTAARYLAAAEKIDLAAWLSAAATEPTHARYLAARSIIGDLEKTWHTTKGKLPDATWKKAEADEAVLSQFSRVVRDWAGWASEHRTTSARFFDRDRRDWRTR